MAENSARHWQDPVNLILGILMLISPWVLGYHAAQGRATDNAVLFGILIGLAAIAAMVDLRAWKEWINVIFGAWLFISPWALGFAGVAAAAWSAWVLGAIVFILALWELGTDQQIGGWWSHAH